MLDHVFRFRRKNVIGGNCGRCHRRSLERYDIFHAILLGLWDVASLMQAAEPLMCHCARGAPMLGPAHSWYAGVMRVMMVMHDYGWGHLLRRSQLRTWRVYLRAGANSDEDCAAQCNWSPGLR
jgi:hypothetical protein